MAKCITKSLAKRLQCCSNHSRENLLPSRTSLLSLRGRVVNLNEHKLGIAHKPQPSDYSTIQRRALASSECGTPLDSPARRERHAHFRMSKTWYCSGWRTNHWIKQQTAKIAEGERRDDPLRPRVLECARSRRRSSHDLSYKLNLQNVP